MIRRFKREWTDPSRDTFKCPICSTDWLYGFRSAKSAFAFICRRPKVVKIRCSHCKIVYQKGLVIGMFQRYFIQKEKPNK
jgi:hypothetical protein